MTLDDPVWNGWTQSFREGMQELGYVEGQNLVIVEAPRDGGDLQTTLATIRRLRDEDRVDVIVSSVLPITSRRSARRPEPCPSSRRC
jgi:hypothetical protein